VTLEFTDEIALQRIITERVTDQKFEEKNQAHT
jgi:hypothetical protein